MAVIPVKVPLWDGNDTATIEGQRTFDSTDEELALKYLTGVNQCADMTSATAPSGTVTCSSEYIGGTGFYAWHAFDRDTGAEGVWNTNGTNTGWIAYEFPSSSVIRSYRIRSAYNSVQYGGMPKSWTFEGWNGTSWDTLDTQTNVPTWADNEWRSYACNSSEISYTKYRLDITANEGYTNVFIDEIEMLDIPTGYSADSPTPTEAWQSLPAGSVVDMSTVRVPENMNSGDAGSVKYKYASNNGALNGTWLTLANLQLEADITITDSTNSFKVLPQYISDGSQKTTSQAFALVDVDTSGSGSGCDLTSGGVLDTNKGLVFKANDASQNSKVDIDAYEIVLQNASNQVYIAQSVNLTADITASGINGLDTGSEAASTWYYVWVIYNGTTVAGLISLSATAPTMPSGYTYKAYIGAICNNGSSTTYRTFTK